jgi:hypothetical protein
MSTRMRSGFNAHLRTEKGGLMQIYLHRMNRMSRRIIMMINKLPGLVYAWLE